MSKDLKESFYGFKQKLKYSKYFNAFYPFLKIPDVKFFIYTRGRTGSTVLTDLLNSHPDMLCDYEIFSISNTKSKIKYPLLYVNSCSKRATVKNKPVYGFKVKIEQLKNEHGYKDIAGLLKMFYDNGWKIIYLKRENILSHSISGIISNKTNIFHVRNGNNFLHEKINIDCRHLLDVMKYFDDLGKQEEQSLKNVPHVNVSYETDLLDNSNHQKTADRIFDFLGINACPVNTGLKKIIPENLKNFIQNYEEMHEAVSSSEYSKYL